MFKRIGITAAILAVLAVPVGAEGEMTGICITALPRTAGTLYLGERILRPGDVLTAEQAAQMTFAPAEAGVETVQIGYLPIREDGTAEETAMTISIHGKENKMPVAEDCALETYKNLEITGQLKATEPEGEAMTFTLTRPPKRGTVEIGEDGSFTYTPKKNKVGIDSFTYTASDPGGKTSREATVTVTILKPTDSVRYTDTAGKACCFTAEWMRNTGIFVGENVGGNPVFSPEKAVTQGEFLTMLVNALNIPAAEETAVFEDAPRWLKPYLTAALRAGLPVSVTTFAAEEIMDSAEAAKLVCAALGSDGWELPSGNLTRADAAQLLYSAAQAAKTNPKVQAWQ